MIKRLNGVVHTEHSRTGIVAQVLVLFVAFISLPQEVNLQPVLPPFCTSTAHGTRTIAKGGRMTRSNARTDVYSHTAFSSPFSSFSLLIPLCPAYTTLFGAYTSFLFLCTSSLVPPLTTHVFCNIIGVPGVQSEMRRFPAQVQNIIAFYIVGIRLFFAMLEAWTESPTSLY
ncbi:hypothetical protein B0H14DRAFT_3469589 [Mycena olivaceomarginata]|nr:hypothetical protein B0H14DRAFT_3469589 [Mycena olivaceomarginata]